MKDEKKKKKKLYDLIPAAMHQHVRELVDFDYLGDLSDEELEWLNQFSAEYYNNNFMADELLTPDKTQRRTYYRRNNERLRDMWNKFRRMPYDYTDFINKKDDSNND